MEFDLWRDKLEMFFFKEEGGKSIDMVRFGSTLDFILIVSVVQHIYINKIF